MICQLCYLFILCFLLQTNKLSSTNSVSYGGMTIECYGNCAGDSDPDLLEIDQICEKTIKKVFDWRHHLLDPYKTSHFFIPWIRTGSNWVVFDWEATDGTWAENKKKMVSTFSYPEFLEFVSQLRRDLRFYYLESPELLKNHLKTLLPKLQAGYREGYRCVTIVEEDLDFDIKLFGICQGNDLKDYIASTKKEISEIEEELASEAKYQEKAAIAEQAIARMDCLYKEVFVFCLQNHQEEGARFESALESLIIGDFETAFDQISTLIELCEKKNLGDDLLAKLYLLKGQVQSEFSLYGDAVVALTQSIQKNPSLKESYFERAAAYFELGKFDQAIEDYLTSEYEAPQTGFEWGASAQLSAGMVAGILEGGVHSLADFVPESLSTLRGLSNGLWALATHPIDASSAVAAAAFECVNYLRKNSSFNILQDMVPELKNLIQNYDHLSDFEKGGLIGQVIGKYGIDILVCKYSTKAVKAYIDLKKGNQALTLKSLASPATSQEVLKEANKRWAHREAVLKNNTLKIEWDKQGKHIEGHRNYDPAKRRSVWECSKEKTESLIKEFAGTGVKDHRSTAHIPGMAGYHEIVDFGEIIGYEMELKTGLKTPTTLGKIHYAKEGLHVVPHIRRKN